MIGFTLLGLIVATIVLCVIGLVGLACLGYNPQDSKGQGWGGIALIAVAVYGIYWVWAVYSPLGIVVVQ